MKKTILGFALAVGFVGTASAAVYNYQTSFGNGIGLTNVAIDTDAMTATFTGNNINLVMGDASLANWTPQLSTKGTAYTVDSMTGTFTRSGRTYDAFFSTNPKHTQFRLGTNYSFLWMYGRDAAGRVLDFDGKGSYTTFTGSSGGSTSGGTSVPEPGMLALFGLAAAGVVFGRRRKTRKAKKVHLAFA